MSSGPIHSMIATLVEGLSYANLVEAFKYVACKLSKSESDDTTKLRANTNAVDIFIALKWTFLIILWNFDVNSSAATIVLWYLIYSNLFTYCYYHVWNPYEPTAVTNEREQRRFLNLILAVAFSTFAFAYLYQVVYPFDFSWSEKVPVASYAIQFSFSNSLAANYEQVRPITDLGNKIATQQFLISFIFVAIVLSRTNSPTEK